MLDTDQATAVRTSHHRGVPVVAVTGEVDSTTVQPARTDLFGRLDRRPPRLVVDLSDVRFIGSTGLQLLAEVITRAERSGTALAVVARHRAVLVPMRITELDQEVAVCGTVDEAVAAVLAR